MKTIRDILDDKMFPSGEVVKKSTGKVDPLMTQALVKIRNDNIDQALKELEEVILESLPENKEPAISAFKAVPKSQMLEARNNTIYNQALEDTRKAIKDLIRGK